jgi:hypothetical protein
MGAEPAEPESVWLFDMPSEQASRKTNKKRELARRVRITAAPVVIADAFSLRGDFGLCLASERRLKGMQRSSAMRLGRVSRWIGPACVDYATLDPTGRSIFGNTVGCGDSLGVVFPSRKAAIATAGRPT